LQRLQPLGATGSPAVLTLQALLQQRLGHPQEALALADTVEASRYRHPLYIELRQHLAGDSVRHTNP
jgi:hypothetical protein